MFRLLGGGSGGDIEDASADDGVSRTALRGCGRRGRDGRHDFGQLFVIRLLGLGLGFGFGFSFVRSGTSRSLDDDGLTDLEGLVRSTGVPGLDVAELDVMGFGDGPEGVASLYGIRAFFGDCRFGSGLTGGLSLLIGLLSVGLRGSRLGEGGGRQNQFLADADLGRFGQAIGAGEGLPADAVLIGDAGKRVTGFDDDGALRGGGGAGLRGGSSGM